MIVLEHRIIARLAYLALRNIYDEKQYIHFRRLPEYRTKHWLILKPICFN